MQVKSFIVQGTTRHVIRVQIGDGTQEYRTMKLTGAQLNLYYGGGGMSRGGGLAGEGDLGCTQATFVGLDSIGTILSYVH